MIRRIIRTRRRRILAAAGTLGLCSALAFAAWLTDGTGQGGGRFAQLQGLTVQPGTAPNPGACSPGNPCEGVFRITNPNPALVLTSIENANGGSMGAGGNCNISYINVPTRTLNIPLPSGTTDVTVPGAFTIAADAPNDCQGREFAKAARLVASTP